MYRNKFALVIGYMVFKAKVRPYLLDYPPYWCMFTSPLFSVSVNSASVNILAYVSLSTVAVTVMAEILRNSMARRKGMFYILIDAARHEDNSTFPPASYENSLSPFYSKFTALLKILCA